MIISGWIIGWILIILGIIGCIVPMLPWIQLAYLGILIFHFMAGRCFSTWFLVFWWIVVIGTIIIDQLLPPLTTKKFGGSNRWVKGSLMGTLIGLFFGFLGVIIWPFLGARIGEYLKIKKRKKALKPALWSFLGLVMSWWIKIALCIVLWCYLVAKFIEVY